MEGKRGEREKDGERERNRERERERKMDSWNCRFGKWWCRILFFIVFTFGYRFKRIKVGMRVLLLAFFQLTNKQNRVTVVSGMVFTPLSLSGPIAVLFSHACCT